VNQSRSNSSRRRRPPHRAGPLPARIHPGTETVGTVRLGAARRAGALQVPRRGRRRNPRSQTAVRGELAPEGDADAAHSAVAGRSHAEPDSIGGRGVSATARHHGDCSLSPERIANLARRNTHGSNDPEFPCRRFRRSVDQLGLAQTLREPPAKPPSGAGPMRRSACSQVPAPPGAAGRPANGTPGRRDYAGQWSLRRATPSCLRFRPR
jgi:hypothetical protein